MTSDSPDYIKVIEVTQPDVSVQVNPIIVVDLADGMKSGAKTCTTAGTSYQITATATTIYGVAIKANSVNTGIIYAGDSTGQHLELKAREGLTIPINDLSKLYIKSTVDGEGISYLYMTRA